MLGERFRQIVRDVLGCSGLLCVAL